MGHFGSSTTNCIETETTQGLEIGAGIGTMIERMLEWKMLQQAHYTTLNSLPENAQAALPRLFKMGSQATHANISKSALPLAIN